MQTDLYLDTRQKGGNTEDTEDGREHREAPKRFASVFSLLLRVLCGKALAESHEITAGIYDALL
jgi:hypothetical protein